MNLERCFSPVEQLLRSGLGKDVEWLMVGRCCSPACKSHLQFFVQKKEDKGAVLLLPHSSEYFTSLVHVPTLDWTVLQMP